MKFFFRVMTFTMFTIIQENSEFGEGSLPRQCTDGITCFSRERRDLRSERKKRKKEDGDWMGKWKKEERELNWIGSGRRRHKERIDCVTDDGCYACISY